jgi:putative acetyltransferase
MPRLRRAESSDLVAIADLWHRAYHASHDRLVPAALLVHRTRESFLTRSASRVDETTVAETEMELCGFIVVKGAQVEQYGTPSVVRGWRFGPQGSTRGGEAGRSIPAPAVTCGHSQAHSDICLHPASSAVPAHGS